MEYLETIEEETISKATSNVESTPANENSNWCRKIEFFNNGSSDITINKSITIGPGFNVPFGSEFPNVALSKKFTIEFSGDTSNNLLSVMRTFVRKI